MPIKHRSNATTQRLRAGGVLHGEYLTGWQGQRKRQCIGYQTGVVGFVTGEAGTALDKTVGDQKVLNRESNIYIAYKPVL